MNAESSANENQPPHNTAKDPGSNSGRMNTIRINIASIAPVAAPEKMMFFQFINNPIILDLYMPRANATILSNVLRILTAYSGAMLTIPTYMTHCEPLQILILNSWSVAYLRQSVKTRRRGVYTLPNLDEL